MTTHRRVPAWLGAIVVPVVLGATSGCSSCRKSNDVVKKDDGRKSVDMAAVPLPPDLAFEAVFRDPDAAVKRGADAAGYGKEVGASPWQALIAAIPDPDAQRAMRTLDPHGAMSFVVTAKADDLVDESKWGSDTVQVVFAAHVKDAELVKTALLAVTKSKPDFRSQPAKAFEGTIYPLDKDLAIALSGDLVLAGDGVAALEKAGRYGAWLASKGNKQEHDLTLRLPLDALEGKVQKLLPEWWAKERADVPPKIAAEIDPLVPVAVQAFGEAGDGLASIDVKGDQLVLEQSMSAKGSLSRWLAAFPSGDPSALLAAPRSDGAAVYRWADGLGPLIYVSFESLLDDEVKRTKMTVAEATDLSKQLRALGGSLGHEVVYASKVSGGGLGALGSGGGLEYVARIELADAGAAKGAITTLRAYMEKDMKSSGAKGTKVTVTPYSRAGAEGETITVATAPSPYSVAKMDSAGLWAVRGSYLYVDVCVFCVPSLDAAMIDPAAKGTLGEDAAAKAKIAGFPSTGVIGASYGDMGAYLKSAMAMIGGLPSGGSSAPAGGWMTASGDGMRAHEELPLAMIGDMVRMYMRMFAPGAYGGYPSPMGTPTPPPMPVPEE